MPKKKKKKTPEETEKQRRERFFYNAERLIPRYAQTLEMGLTPKEAKRAQRLLDNSLKGMYRWSKD